MSETYQIRHNPNGEFWIWTQQDYDSGPEWDRFIGPFKDRYAAEAGLHRLVKQPIWKYDEHGNLME